MTWQINADDTDRTVNVFIKNKTINDGSGLTGLVFDTANLTCYYIRPGAAAAQLSLITQTVTGSHTDGGFVEIDDTNMPGIYRLDLSDAIVASGVDNVLIQLQGAADMAPAVVEIQLDLVDNIWDELLQGNTHNIKNSSGKRLRDISSNVIRENTAQGAGTGNNQIQFDTGASSTDDIYDPGVVSIISGTGEGQSRQIIQYDGTTKTATVDRDWRVNPDNTSEFQILADAGREHVNDGLARGATDTTITLNALASSITDAYIGQTVFIRSGTGQDQTRTVNAYNTTTKVATVNRAWDTNPDTTSGYVMLPDRNSLETDQLSEITGASDIPATPTIPQAIILLYMRERNNSQVIATERRIVNDAGTEILDATISDDGTTFSQGKLGAA